MTMYVTEHGVNSIYRQPLLSPPLAAYSLTSASTAGFPSAGAKYIRVSADAGMYLNVISTSTGVSLTSTNAIRIAANSAPELISVSTNYRVQAAST